MNWRMRIKIMNIFKSKVAFSVVVGSCVLFMHLGGIDAHAATIVTNTVTLDVVADTYIASNLATTPQNGDVKLTVGYAGGTKRALIRFDTSSITFPAGAVLAVSSAVLKVTNTGTGGLNDPDVGIYDYAYDFGETSATWNNPAGNGSDSTAGGTIGTLLASIANLNDDADVSHTFASSPAFQSVVETALAGDNTINLLVKRPNDSGTSNDYILFRNRELNASGYFQLMVTYELTLPPAGTVIIIR